MKYALGIFVLIVLAGAVFSWKYPVLVQEWFTTDQSGELESIDDLPDAPVQGVTDASGGAESAIALDSSPEEGVSTREDRRSEQVEGDEATEETGSLVINEAESQISMTTNNTINQSAPEMATMMLAGGCFWCVEADLEKLAGVVEVVSGYAGGTTENPTYQNYKSGGHREVVEVTYDPATVTYEEILIYAMKHMDPTDDDGSFYDRGDGYSPAFYHENDEQRAIIDNLIAEVNENGPYDKPLAIDIEKRPAFWPAEDFHQDYYKGALSSLKYKAYRTASGRDRFIRDSWGDDTGADLSWREGGDNEEVSATGFWSDYQKPSKEVLKQELDATVYKVTQEDGTERAGSSPLDKVYEPGIYVDVLSGEPLFSSRDKFDSRTGWPSFVKPITPSAVTEHEDRKLFTVRTEIRSVIADNHIGHVFNDGPADRGGLRYCMNGVALEFVPEAEMEARGYGDFLQYL